MPKHEYIEYIILNWKMIITNEKGLNKLGWKKTVTF